MAYYWTLTATSQLPGRLHSRFPQAGHHNSENLFFVDSDPNAVDPILINPVVSEGEDYDEEFLRVLLEELMEVDRTKPIHITKRQAGILHRYPIWIVWRDGYVDVDGQVDVAAKRNGWDEARVAYPALTQEIPLTQTDIKTQLKSVMKRTEAQGMREIK